jgi:3-deoxy-7-phosphoheptulonate synthase
MPRRTDDLRISEIKELSTPEGVMAECVRTDRASRTVTRARTAIQDILHGRDDRLLVVVGPCSIHDTWAAIDYAKRLAAERARLSNELEIVMRVYFEKPRTTVGWKGLINDPGLDGSFEINKGLRLARGVLRDVNELGLPAATEFLDTTIPQFIADLVAWAAIGARTTESQIHREMASGLSCPVGFKNGTDGNVKIALDAIRSAAQPHHFLAVTKTGQAGIAATKGNPDCHTILRGGKVPNFDAASVRSACEIAENAGVRPAIMIDASHANSAKNHDNQPRVIENVATQIEAGETRIIGLMVESNIVAGRQDLGGALRYGQSVTDACIGWEDTLSVLDRLAASIRARRTLADSGERQMATSKS